MAIHTLKQQDFFNLYVYRQTNTLLTAVELMKNVFPFISCKERLSEKHSWIFYRLQSSITASVKYSHDTPEELVLWSVIWCQLELLISSCYQVGKSNALFLLNFTIQRRQQYTVPVLEVLLASGWTGHQQSAKKHTWSNYKSETHKSSRDNKHHFSSVLRQQNKAHSARCLSASQRNNLPDKSQVTLLLSTN